MAKKRRTRQEKIIIRLKRELAKRESVSIKSKPSQGAIFKPEKIEPPKKVLSEKTDFSVFSLNLALIKKDLLKTLILSLIIFSLEIVLYLNLK